MRSATAMRSAAAMRSATAMRSAEAMRNASSSSRATVDDERIALSQAPLVEVEAESMCARRC